MASRFSFLLRHGDTKGLNYEDAFAHEIAEEFIDRVNPQTLILFLPPDLLTPADEERIVSIQEHYCRADAAACMLALISQRGDWVSRLQQGLRHRQIRLEDFADRIEDMQKSLPMEIDFSWDDSNVMEVDAEPWYDPAPGVSQTGVSREMLEARSLKEVLEPSQGRSRQDTQLLLIEIAHKFFVQFASNLEDVQKLTECFERIVTAVAVGVTINCLEIRLRVDSVRDLRELRRLAERGILSETAERCILTEKQHDWLRAELDANKLRCGQIKLRASIPRECLDRCEAFLRVKEEVAGPRSPGEALLMKITARDTTEALSEDYIEDLPTLLTSFVECLLGEHPSLARDVSSSLAVPPLGIAITKTMKLLRQHFGLTDKLEKDLCDIKNEMLSKLEETGKASSGDVAGAETAKVFKSSLAHFTLLVEALHPLRESVERLEKIGLMRQQKADTFSFSHILIADFALGCIPDLSRIPENYVSRALQFGSSFAVLPVLDILLSSKSDEGLISGLETDQNIVFADKVIDEQLCQYMIENSQAMPVVDMYMQCFSLERLLNRVCFWTYGATFKTQLRELLTLSGPGTMHDILVCPLDSSEIRELVELAQAICSARHTIDLTGKLDTLNPSQLKVVLACAQLTNVAEFRLVEVDGLAALRIVKEDEKDVCVTSSSVGQPSLKLCQNRLENRHVESILDALTGLESVSYYDLSECRISFHDLQCLLNRLHRKSVKTVILKAISFSDKKGGMLPMFSHLSGLQAIDLSMLGLQDEQMPLLVQQLRELPDLRELSLDKNPITIEGLSQLTAVLAPCASLRLLRVPSTQSDAGGAFVLGAALRSAVNLQVLNLSDCRLQDSGLQHLSLSLKSHTKLSKVSLRDGGYSPSALVSFFNHLGKCNRMQHLEIGKCPLEGNGFDVSDKLLAALSASNQWNYLGLWCCRIGHTSFLKRLSELPFQLRGLTTLVLQDNGINDDQIPYLTRAVHEGQIHHLRRLNLNQNNIRESGAMLLAEALSGLPHLSELLLRHSGIPASGALVLSKEVIFLPGMRLLDISDSSAVSPDEVAEILDDLEEKLQGGVAVKSYHRYYHVLLDVSVIAEKIHSLRLEPLLRNAQLGQGIETDVARLKLESEPPSSVTEHRDIAQESLETISPKREAVVAESGHRPRVERRAESLLIDDNLCISLEHHSL